MYVHRGSYRPQSHRSGEKLLDSERGCIQRQIAGLRRPLGSAASLTLRDPLLKMLAGGAVAGARTAQPSGAQTHGKARSGLRGLSVRMQTMSVSPPSTKKRAALNMHAVGS